MNYGLNLMVKIQHGFLGPMALGLGTKPQI